MLYYFSFDVESVGLLGEPFAVGWVIVDDAGNELDNGFLSYPYPVVLSSEEDIEWIEENIIPHLPETNCVDLNHVSDLFWDAWKAAQYKYKNITMVCDVPFPVEANFLLNVLAYLSLGMEDSPYPVLDVSSILFAAGADPVGEQEWLPGELPKHHPTNDARQSVRVMLEALKELAE